ncbi:hypothetical protein HDU96_001628 [Phlyctochytrium bullatum]|nr:hypothetical protein HDU96_001628 [Phlyctochytrium bullatum]
MTAAFETSVLLDDTSDKKEQPLDLPETEDSPAVLCGPPRRRRRCGRRMWAPFVAAALACTLLVATAGVAGVWRTAGPRGIRMEPEVVAVDQDPPAPPPPPTIPRHIWTYWPTSRPPTPLLHLLHSWKHLHPLHTLTLLTPQTLPLHLAFPNLPAFFLAAHPRHQADWARAAVLATKGGVWLDPGVVLTRSVEEGEGTAKEDGFWVGVWRHAETVLGNFGGDVGAFVGYVVRLVGEEAAATVVAAAEAVPGQDDPRNLTALMRVVVAATTVLDGVAAAPKDLGVGREWGEVVEAETGFKADEERAVEPVIRLRDPYLRYFAGFPGRSAVPRMPRVHPSSVWAVHVLGGARALRGARAGVRKAMRAWVVEDAREVERVRGELEEEAGEEGLSEERERVMEEKVEEMRREREERGREWWKRVEVVGLEDRGVVEEDGEEERRVGGLEALFAAFRKGLAGVGGP